MLNDFTEVLKHLAALERTYKRYVWTFESVMGVREELRFSAEMVQANKVAEVAETLSQNFDALPWPEYIKNSERDPRYPERWVVTLFIQVRSGVPKMEVSHAGATIATAIPNDIRKKVRSALNTFRTQ